MQRAQRARGNPALDFAIELGDELDLPVRVFFAPMPRYPHATLRGYAFLFAGIPELAAEVRARRCSFTLRYFPDHRIDRFAEETGAAAVVGDENPLREPEAWRRRATERLRVPLVTVDADVLVPSKLFPKQEWAARTLRPKYRRLMGDRLLPIESKKARRLADDSPRSEDPLHAAVPDSWRIDRTTAPVRTFDAGPCAARRALDAFVRDGLRGYAANRNLPELAATSRLSPYLHFGHVGPQEVAHAVHVADAPEEDRDAFLEELLVRRELAVNFVARNRDYDRLSGCPAWALKTLDAARADSRPFVYDAATLRSGLTHDPLWNAAQLEMTKSGHMHGYMRMYWAKKILEWTRAPEEAFALALAMNDAYELDGRDPSGYAGVAWAIGGLHDRPWGPRRPVFGTVRYMNAAGASRKFDTKAYVARVAAMR